MASCMVLHTFRDALGSASEAHGCDRQAGQRMSALAFGTVGLRRKACNVVYGIADCLVDACLLLLFRHLYVKAWV